MVFFTLFWVAVVQQFLIWLSSSIFRKNKVSSSFKPGFLLHGNVENWRCFIFGTSEIGATLNPASHSDSLP